ncbi:helix-turn-helix domain-containing protein [Staphylococcus delphini]|uniref:Helix-turn-helix domain-containing protein n=1 Tax=Staphylococcus delphini TaxID=53344 RepID=A0AAP8B097_9STAP|nr:helix-turn-helix domain-containing protein [Staphylococcus delphini]MDE9752685.1 helix-turn-helix domain-containing protein [Staphylococcus delphini]MDE9789863.1 helix-turn-helix domain-containing protein [Staphylococcus delphini]MDE9792181.1 helix-turn-helix domain-containing protein [Staphylococcus delphini]MDE9794972.1 helix-turn-helix domain-containing protein [Staphylococcus delphini]MDE9796164.1 helix-turn-helix domain-containing protein [Staphylococcus delphini]
MRTIGEVLQSKRERLGMTLTELEKRTQIQRETLIDIEQNRFDQFKHPNYIRGFIQKYAQSVNIDGRLLIEKHHEELPAVQRQAHIILEQIAQQKEVLTFQQLDQQPKKIAILIGLLTGVTAVLWVLMTLML